MDTKYIYHMHPHSPPLVSTYQPLLPILKKN
jgi:hypothetical protein